MKKIFYRAFTVLQVILLITAFGIQYFSVNKMGMMRYVVFKNHSWENQYPISAIQYTVLTLLIILLAITFVIYLKNNCIMKKVALKMLIVQVIITLVFSIFTLAYSTVSYVSYYFTQLILSQIALIQAIKVFICLKKWF